MYEYSALVLRCLDGDSVELSVDCGFSVHHHLIVRLAGINCPEKNTPEGKAAAQFTADWLAKRLGKVLVRTMKGKSFDRYLARIMDHADGADLGDDLIKSGNAVKWGVK